MRLIFVSPLFVDVSFDKVHIVDGIQRLMVKAPLSFPSCIKFLETSC